MKTIFNILKIMIAVFILTSCDRAKQPNVSNEVTIEGCEYFVNQNGYGNTITHKGNCKNPIHKCTCK